MKIREIDRYKLTLFCTCIDCSKRGKPGLAHSCSAYPKRNGIPSKIWNTDHAECEYFEPIASKEEEKEN